MSRLSLYELAPYSLKDPTVDPAKLLQAYLDAVQQELDRQRTETAGIAVLVDADGLNVTFAWGEALCDPVNISVQPERLVVGSVSTDGISVTFDSAGMISSLDDFFVGYGLRALTQTEQNGVANPIANQYAKILDYNGTTKVATVSPPFSQGTTLVGFELCYPRLVYLPPVDGTVDQLFTGTLKGQGSGQGGGGSAKNQVFLPEQFDQGSAPQFTNGYYIHWYLEITSGNAAGTVKKIVAYDGALLRVDVESDYQDPPVKGDTFKLYAGRFTSNSTNYYGGYTLRVMDGPGKGEVRKVVNYFTRVDATGKIVSRFLVLDGNFTNPPAATSSVGILTTHVNLGYLARQVGYEHLDSSEPEILQRQQILGSVDFSKLKGTTRAFELLFRTFGFDADVVEIASDYTPAETDDPGVQEPQQAEVTTGTVSGRPHRIESVLLAEFLRDANFTDGTTDFHLWDSTANIGTGTIAEVAGEAVVTVNGAAAGGRATKLHTWALNAGAVADFTVQVDSTTQANGQELHLARFGDEEATPSYVYLKAKNANRELFVGGENFGADVGTGKTLTLGKKHRIRWRVLEHVGAGTDGILQVYLDGDLIYDGFLVKTLQDAQRIESFSLWCQSGAGQNFNATVRFDEAVLYDVTNTLTDAGGGEDDVTGLVRGTNAITDVGANTGLRIPDSDILIFLRRLNPNVRFDPKLFRRIIQRLEDVRPVHVEIAIVGAALEVDETVLVADALNLSGTFSFAETVTIADTAGMFGSGVSFFDSLVIGDFLEIGGGAFRWNTTDSRWGTQDNRWSIG
jgi:hypothetical protein